MAVDVSGMQEGLRRHAQDAFERAADEMVQLMMDDVPVVTGDLRDKMGHGSVEVSNTELVAEIFDESDHAEFVDQGTVAHDITATQGHGLLVFDADDGTVFVSGAGGEPAVVHHPGTSPNPFFSERMPARWEDVLQRALTDVVTTVP